MPATPANDAWHLDKKVPIALIFALLLQTAGIVWWQASLAARTDDHGRRILLLEATDTRFEVEARRAAETLARLDERMQAQTQILRRIEESLARGAR
jgi:hypothetical protein